MTSNQIASALKALYLVRFRIRIDIVVTEIMTTNFSQGRMGRIVS